MRFYLKLILLALIGYLMLRLFPMPGDYIAMEDAQERFVETCSVVVAQENGGNAVGTSAFEDAKRAYAEYQVALDKWMSDLNFSLG